MEPLASPEVLATREHLLRQCEHLRRNVDYFYPPNVIAGDLRMVRMALAGYREAVKEQRRELRRKFREERVY